MTPEAGALPAAWFVFWMGLGVVLTVGLLWWVVDQARRTDEDVAAEVSPHGEHRPPGPPHGPREG